MEYNFKAIESKWQKFWSDNNTFKVDVDKSKPKFYVLDMFPYPSGAGLHVGHPLGYIASDIYSRYKRLQGHNVLHPMGYDAFGLPAEQYAIQTGQHPAVTTDKNVKRYREQLSKIGFSYDWDREFRTCDTDYYKWTQWVFIELFEHWYNKENQKSVPIRDLIEVFCREGNGKINAATDQIDVFTAEDWNNKSEKQQQEILLNYRIAYLADTMVNWCPALGTVLANDEIKEGLSVRGGHPVVQKKMRQWSLRISAYAERLLEDLNKLEWTDSLKEIQRNWIGRSEGAEMNFKLKGQDLEMEIFTTRPDTSWGVTFMVLAPESDLVQKVTTEEHKAKVEEYILETKKRSERDRMADAKSVSGQFTGAYAINPLNNQEIPIYISDYVLMGYGTGAIMAVPGHDTRDFKFARHFDLPIVQVVVKKGENPTDPKDWDDSIDSKEGKMINSGFINDLDVNAAIKQTIQYIEEKGIGKRKVNFRLRDAIFSRQRYWGEPFPVYFKEGLPYVLEKDKLPLELPKVDVYLPTEDGEPPLGRAKNWTTEDGYPFELSTMPGFAGSSAYYLRYMDPKNNEALVSEEANEYWQDVDLYIGGTEHATGHLIYSRFWNKFLFDIGWVCKDEPFRKLINQGMIQGRSSFVYRIKYNEFKDDAKKILSNFVPYLNYKKELKFTKNPSVRELRNLLNFRKGDVFYFDEENNIVLISRKLPSRIKRKIEEGNLRDKYEFLVLSEKEIKDKVIFNERINNFFKQGLELSVGNLENTFVSFNLRKEYDVTPIHVDVNIVSNDILDTEAFKNWNPEYKNAEFILEDGKYHCGHAVEKMSKSLYNVVNPDDVIEQYGADTLRMYEMFLGPLEMSKPWDTNGIDGVHKFLRKFWRLFHDDQNNISITEETPTKDELKVLHKTIKKIQEDIERFSFNTSVSAFMICVNELTDLKCKKRDVLEPLLVLLSSFAPHITEELWQLCGNNGSITYVSFPKFEAKYLVESSFEYPVSFNGKMRFKLELPMEISAKEAEDIVLSHEQAIKWLDGKTPRKIIFVPKKIINIVI
ncbi:MAG: leucine--tRNA ligase [Bacteroidales bacterium]|nr:leucine--tRNA ligase [Bacteroidales bacterium]